MCGIVGLFIKDPSLESQLGSLLSDMLITMTDRGPDSAGFAVYSNPDSYKITVQSTNPEDDFATLADDIQRLSGVKCDLTQKSTHAVLSMKMDQAAAVRSAIDSLSDSLSVMSAGEAIEIYKEVGLPEEVSERFNLSGMTGSHAIGHTRMATESAVTTSGAHPFSTGSDQCLVHNGSLSNHNNLRRILKKKGIKFETENDTEVGAAYISDCLSQGMSLGDSLEKSLDDIDGFYTFVVGTKNGFGILRDPIACKPAVLAETDQYVAFGSEYRALVNLPGIETAKVWEPEPATVYFWEK